MQKSKMHTSADALNQDPGVSSSATPEPQLRRAAVEYGLEEGNSGEHRSRQGAVNEKRDPSRSDVQLQCGICGKFLKSKDGLRKHMKWHERSTSGEHRSRLGAVKRPAQKDLSGKSPKRAKTESFTEQCGICGGRFANKNSVKRHIKLVHKGYPCTFCEEVFESPAERKSHVKVVHRVQCSICSDTFVSKQALQNHMLTKHSSEPRPTFPCSHCSMTFSTLPSRKRHEDEKHTGQVKKHQCEFCGKLFFRRCEWLHHVKRHMEPQ
jgi:uncharacterized Zn-finger protein